MTSTDPRHQAELHGYWELPETRLAFDPTDRTQTALHPLLGLREFGPFSRRALRGTDPAVRVALLAPSSDLPALRKQLNELVHEHEPRERPAYLPAWPGFRQVFDARLEPAHQSAQLGLPADLDDELNASTRPHQHLAHTLGEGLRRLSVLRDRFDVVAFYLPPRYRSLFENREEGFDLHDSVKAVGAQLGLPTQIITRDALSYRCRASVAWRLATALYAKGGGTPWKLDTTQAPLDPETVYIGISYALHPAADGSTSFVTCCSQVFDSDGGGMEFIAYDVGQGTDLRNPFLTRSDMRLVMSRSLTLYQDRHRGHTPRRLVVHKKTPFTKEETAGCMDAWGAATALECVSITRSSWRGLTLGAPRRWNERAVPGYAMQRGTSFQLDDRSVLVWVAGNAPEATLTGKANYLQGGKGTPRPLLLSRDAGAGPLTETAAQVLALSKMDWNNDALYDGDPCTLRYADVLARTIKHIPNLAPLPYDYRLFM